MHAAVSAEPIFTLDRVVLRPARLREVSLAIARGVTAVIGWSGAGKTSLLNVLARFEKPDSGKLSGETRVAWVPQSDGLWPQCTATGHLTECGSSRDDAAALLRAFDLNERASARPGTLSRGEQSRLAVARALATRAPVFIMDEPLAHVDPARAGGYWRVIREHIATTGASLVFATHQPDIALGNAQHAVAMHDGALVFHGGIATLYHDPAIAELMHLLGPGNWLAADDARTWNLPAGCVRPERIIVSENGDGPCEVVASRFCGTHAETEVRCGDARRVFVHRPAGVLAAGARVVIGVEQPR
jgi:iron(III) transport system ATP-binding protein